MMRRTVLALLGTAGCLSASLATWPAISADTPQLKTSSTNVVPACVAPARLMQHVARLNPKLDPRFREIASLYQSHGQSLALRWDYAFFQMLAETDNLAFTGEVSKDRNNFAGIRTPDSSAPERFPDVSTGVLAHLHHIRLYAGDPVAKPAARRTKQVENFILSWSRQLRRPVRFDDMIARWSPNNPGYARTIEQSLKDYQVAHCAGEVAALAGGDDKPVPSASKSRKVKAARGETRAAPADAPEAKDEPQTEPTRVAGLAANASRLGVPASQLNTQPSAKEPLPSGAVEAATPSGAAASGAQCKVWSASFGGEKSVLIRVADGAITHFTALQVNAGREKEETTAYIAAYARGGKSVGDFSSADQAINKAFELCPKS